MNLQSHILERFYSKDLVDLHNQVPTVRADVEIANRLRAGDIETLMAIKEIREMTPLLREAVREYPMPWRIGIIYNYQTGKIISVQASLGVAARKRYQVQGRPIKFSWLDSRKSQLVLYEVNNFEEGGGKHRLDNRDVLPVLLNNQVVLVRLALISNPQGWTYETPLPSGENYRYQPVQIETKNTVVPLFPNGIQRSVGEKVKVETGPDVEIYKMFS